ncbi:lig_chan-Glu_bd domain-containing protein [Nephila pilipes]|uniref:Lig_chan-Glu_bd domain-containing protein n=1 Tax=Nephila pilipes TaxID=299642 RepID=A0A8X6UNF0_NEPPI|nr:lig_chan-Glu_bd domain-containing protein [Nephila pilipes]
MKDCKKWIIATLNRSRIFEIYPNSDGKPRIDGIEAKLVKTIMSKIGVDYEIVIPKDGQYGLKLNDGNWTGIMGMLHKGEADIGVSNIGMYEDRYKSVDFSLPYMWEGMHFSYLKSAYQEDLFGFLRLFDFSTFMSFLGSLFLTAIVILIILKKQETFSSIMLYLFGSFLRQTLILHKQINEWKIIFMSWLVFAFVMSSAYSGALLSFLTLPSKGKTVETYQELAEAVAKDSYRVYSLRGSQFVLFFQRSPAQHLQYLGDMIEKNDWYITPDDMTHNPLKKKDSPDNKTRVDAILGGRYIFKMLYEVGDFKSKVFISEERSMAGSVGIAFRKGFCGYSEVNKILTRILEAGMYEKFLKDESMKYWLSLSPEEKKEMQTSEDRSLSVRDLAGAFVLLLAGLLVSLLVFFLEITAYYLKFCS